MTFSLPSDSEMWEPGFVFGAATAAFQIEGDAEGRMPGIWDTFCAEPGRIRDGSDGRVACDHYHRWEEDLDLLVELGLDAYRFSISWPRVMNADGSANETGLQFYRQLVDGLADRGIKAFLTLYHWNLPQYLQDRGGWANRQTACEFARYVEHVVKALGSGVHAWTTLNEPMCSAYFGHETGMHAPGIQDPMLARQAGHHLLLAHGLAMEVLRKHAGDSLLGIVLNYSPCDAASDSEADRQAAALADATLFRRYLDAVLRGRYPDILEDSPGGAAPDMRDGDLSIISQAIDYLGINYYSRLLFGANETGGFEAVEASGPVTEMGWEVTPGHLTELLQSLHRDYDLPPVYITENGAAYRDHLRDGRVDDPERVAYFRSHLAAVDDAIRAGVDVRGYFCWSLMDNFEWSDGYTRRFGLYYVDYPTQSRIIKSSGRAWQQFLASRRRRNQRQPAGVN